MIIEVNNLIADYGQKALIRNLSFKISHPAFVAILGHNGCGKTTFFKALTNQITYQGEILYDGRPARTIPNLARSGILAVLEQKNPVSFRIRVLDLVVMGCFRTKRFFQNYTPDDYRLAEAALRKLGVAQLAEQDFLALSGGEQQMVWLAQLMLQDTRLYLLDEPTQHLDIRNKKRVFDSMQQWVEQDGKTVLCITHDIHNLYGCRGYLLNLSAPAPTLQPITPATIEQNLKLLEE